MSRTFIGVTLAAGNGTDASLFTMPAGSNGFLSSILAYNSSGGTLTLTFTLTRGGVDNIISVSSLNTVTSKTYNPGDTTPITPVVLKEGDIFKAKGSGTGITVTISGLAFSNT